MKQEDKEYLESLNKAYLESSAQFDRQVLFLASGALGLSFAFIKDIIAVQIANYRWMLILSWSLFSVVILFSVISHYTSLKAINNAVKNLAAEEDFLSKNFNKATQVLNVLMIIFLGVGLALLILFISLNLF